MKQIDILNECSFEGNRTWYHGKHRLTCAVCKQHFCTGNAVCRQHFLLILLVVLAEKYYLCQPENICAKVNGFCKPLPLFKDYLQYGYYPYYMENQRDYYTTMEQVANFVIETELPQLCSVDAGNTRKIKTLLGILATPVPFEVVISKLSALIGVHRNTTLEYLADLGRADLLNLLYADLVSVKKMQKPDKIYLENPNMIYALASNPVKIGTVRETFAVNQLKYGHTVEYGKQTGDFRIDGKIIFEVGGADKTFKQIADIPDSYILADDIEYPYSHKLPLWLVGFMY